MFRKVSIVCLFLAFLRANVRTQEFSAPILTPASSTFRKATGQTNDPRTFQTGVRVLW